MIGGALGHVADSCARKGFPLYTMHHEQAAAFAAEAQAIETRKPGLAMATSGPGATNLVTGIGSAYFASIPVLFITGQVNTYESNSAGGRRQAGFQETDIVAIVKSITKYAVQVRRPETIAYHLEKALFLATSGRAGPVLIDLPFDVQRADIDPKKVKHFTGSAEHRRLGKMLSGEPSPALVKRAAELMMGAERPIMLVGHGIRISGAADGLLKLAEKRSIPVVCSLMGTDALQNSHPLFYGFIGTYGNRYSNLAVANSDLMLVLGARLDSRQVGVMSKRFAPMAKIIHVDIDKAELGASVKEALSIHSDASKFLRALLPAVKPAAPNREWMSFLDSLKKKYREERQGLGPDGIDPVSAVAALSEAAGEGDTVAVDVGSNQMWFAQGWKVKKGQKVLTNGGMGPMGYSLPAAVGASLACGKKRAWAVSGDGGMQLNIQEFQTLVRNKIPVKIMVLNNGVLGMLTQFQTENFEGRLIGSKIGYDSPDFVKISRAYGLAAEKAAKRGELREKVEWLARAQGPALLEVVIPWNCWVLPKAVFNRPVHDMRPFLERGEYRSALRYVDEKLM
jgi:acetolactate synthase-1/2/3 large subunit